MRGKISKEWGNANSLYCSIRFNTQQCRINFWAANFIFHLWRFSTLLWTQRNESLHGKDDISKADTLNTTLNDQIRHMFNTARQSIHSDDAHLFLTPFEDRITQTINQKRLWLETVKAALKLPEGYQQPSGHFIQTNEIRFTEDGIQQTQSIRDPTPLRIREGRRPRVRLRD
jgi:hypothetical protein